MSRKHTITTEEEYNIAVQRVVDLARDLPCLADAPGLDPFDPFRKLQTPFQRFQTFRE